MRFKPFMLLGTLLQLQALVQAQVYFANGESVKVTSANELFVQEHLESNVTLDHLTLAGSTNINISGTGNIGSLVLNMPSLSATLISGGQTITNTLTLTAGTLVSGGLLKLASTSDLTARIADHTTAGSISGIVKVERFFPGSRNKQWRTIGFPYSSSLAMNSITGVGISFNPQTWLVFLEGNDDKINYGSSASRNSGYMGMRSTYSITPGDGVMAWMYSNTTVDYINNGQPLGSGGLTMLSSGTLNESGNAVSINLSHSGTNNTEKGWNLISNPFASNIDWNAVMTSNPSANIIGQSYYQYDPQSASWKTYSPGSSSTASRYIESGSGFFVKVSGASTLSITQSHKTSTASTASLFSANRLQLDIPTQQAGANETQRLSGIRISASGPGNPAPDEVYIDFSKSDATDGIDLKYDAISMGRSSGVGIQTVESGNRLLVFYFGKPILQPGSDKRMVPLVLTTPQPGSVRLKVQVESGWDSRNTLFLLDRKERKVYPIIGGSLDQQIEMTTTRDSARFQLAVNYVNAGADGRPLADVRLLGNPVTSSKLDLLVTHPESKPAVWRMVNAAGNLVKEGRFDPQDQSIRKQLETGLQGTGVYFLHVQFENGDRKVVRFIKNNP